VYILSKFLQNIYSIRLMQRTSKRLKTNSSNLIFFLFLFCIFVMVKLRLSLANDRGSRFNQYVYCQLHTVKVSCEFHVKSRDFKLVLRRNNECIHKFILISVNCRHFFRDDFIDKTVHVNPEALERGVRSRGRLVYTPGGGG